VDFPLQSEALSFSPGFSPVNTGDKEMRTASTVSLDYERALLRTDKPLKRLVKFLGDGPPG
jgi:hypothetical protein